MTVQIVPGSVGTANPVRPLFDNLFMRGCSADVQSCVPTGALNAQVHSAMAPASTLVEAQVAALVARPTRQLSGVSWVEQFPTSTTTDDLNSSFREAVNSFIAAIQPAGGSVRITATSHPPERAYLMHYAWDISKGTIQPDRVPAMTGVDIEWDHGDKAKSVNAASAMVRAYGIVHRPSLTTNHSGRTAIEMSVNGILGKSILDANGKKHIIKKSSDLHSVGATYGVHKLMGDPLHWSADGH